MRGLHIRILPRYEIEHRTKVNHRWQHIGFVHECALPAAFTCQIECHTADSFRPAACYAQDVTHFARSGVALRQAPGKEAFTIFSDNHKIDFAGSTALQRRVRFMIETDRTNPGVKVELLP